MSRLVSAEAARKLLAYLDGERVCHCGTEARRHRDEEHGFVEMVDPEDTTTATVTDLAATVVALSEREAATDAWLAEIGHLSLAAAGVELTHLREREKRLTDILAAERGERAPEGWESTFVVEYEGDRDAYEEPYVTRWQRIADGIHCYAGHSENTHPKCWWNAQDRRNGNKIIGSGKAESLLEAIESADRAAKDPT